MNNQNRSRGNRSKQSSTEFAEHDGESLLQKYLSLPASERDKHFANTARAAEMVGRTPRTIQRWIEAGLINAVSIVGREMVSLESLRELVERRARERDQH